MVPNCFLGNKNISNSYSVLKYQSNSTGEEYNAIYKKESTQYWVFNMTFILQY